MTDLFNLLMLICASVGAMALGVLSAYGIFVAAFALMRPRQMAVAVKTQPETAL